MKQQTIHVYSFDFDGCLSREKGGERKSIADQNILLTLYISLVSGKSQSVVFIGSGRQDFHMDQLNERHNQNGSCFQEIKNYAVNTLNAEFKPLLLADIYGDLASGESYRRATSFSGFLREHKRWFSEPSKVTILYAQMHEIAHIHSNQTISFQFFDDRIDIIEKLYKFFSSNPKLIPKNVTLKLNKYVGVPREHYKTHIVGQGDIDHYYRKTTRYIRYNSQVYDSEGDLVIGMVDPSHNFYRQATRRISTFKKYQKRISHKRSFFSPGPKTAGIAGGMCGGCFAMALLTSVGVANIWNPVGWGIISGVIGAGLLIGICKRRFDNTHPMRLTV